MKKCIHKIWMAMILVTVFSCVQEDHSLTELQGTISFGGISLEFAPMGSPEGRIAGNSPWVHVFPTSVELVFSHKATGKQYVLEYNPNDFSKPYSITLPFGAYAYHSIVEGGIFSAFLPFEARGEFVLHSKSLDLTLKAETEYGLVTVKNQYVEKASISDGKQEADLALHEDSNYWFLYVKGGTAATLKILESFEGFTISRELNIEAYSHYNFVLKLNEGATAIIGLIMAPFELVEEEILIGLSTEFFEENGTIKCPEASPGEKGIVNDKIYEAVDRALLIQRRDEGADLSCVCTSLVTDMSWLFYYSFFNQPIGNWDVSNVTDMIGMFHSAASFNQSIENWDVRNVTSMNSMFGYAASFNQPIGNWNVSNVTDMGFMFLYAPSFNQPIGSWDVSNVMFMGYMFYYAPSFNQPLGDWDVGNVADMYGMFSVASSFNQPIGNWNVSNVANMNRMFIAAVNFNQPIGNWNVSNVTDMSSMFLEARNFNQDLSLWCVQNIPSEPDGFSNESPLLDANKPVWGTCPD